MILLPPVSVLYVYGTYVVPNLGTTFYVCVLRITYARHVAKMASLLSALEAVVHKESDIWTNLAHRETYYSWEGSCS